MGSNWTYAVTALVAGLIAVLERCSVSPIPAMQGRSVSFAGQFGRTNAPAVTTALVALKADDRVPPRGRRH